MARNINQVYDNNPLTGLPGNGLIYIGDSGVDAAIQVVDTFNPYNMQLTAGQYNTIQDIDPNANVIFSSIKINSILSKTAATSITITPTSGYNLDVILSTGGFFTAGASSQFTVSASGAVTASSVAASGLVSCANFRMTTSPINGYVMTTDGSGNGSWTNLASIGVSSISGTTNRITASGSVGAVTIDISAFYVGQASITTLGTVTTGTWNAGVVAGQYGGTGVANTGLTINLSSGGTGKVLTSDVSGNASWAALSGIGVTSITGTSNQVVASASTGAITLSTPQDIATSSSVRFANITLNGAAATSAILTLNSTTQGFLPPSMTTAQKNAISAPSTGLTVFDNVLLDLQFYNGTSWIGASTSGVSTIAGTTNRLTASAPTGSVTLDIAATYVGQTSITTLGTIATGVWNGTVVSSQYGGTGVANTGLTITLASGGTGKVLVSDVLGNATWAALSGIGVTSLTGTGSQILVNGTTGSPVTGAVTLTLPQSIGTSNQVQFGSLGLGYSLSSIPFGSSTTFALNGVMTLVTASQSIVWNAYNLSGWKFLGTGGIYAYGIIADNSNALYFRTSTTADGAGNPITWNEAFAISPIRGHTNFGGTPLNNITHYISKDLLYNSSLDISCVKIDGGLGTTLGIAINATMLSVVPKFSINVQTLTNAYGMFIESGSTAGTITNGYGLRVQLPTFGTNKYTAYFDVGVGIGDVAASNVPFLVRGVSASVYNIYSVGTLQTTDNGLSTGAIIGIFNQTILNPTLGAGAAYGHNNQIAFAAPSTRTIAAAINLDIYSYYTGNVGTITNSYGILIEAGGATAGTITNNFGIYVNRPLAGTNRYTAFFDNFVGIGTTNPVYPLTVNLTATGIGGGFNIAFGQNPTLVPTGAVATSVAQYIFPTFNATAGTIANAYNLFLDGGTNSAGTITTGYGLFVNAVGYGTTRFGLYVARPTGGSNRYTAYLDPIIGIGVTPSANVNLFVSGDIRLNGISNYGILINTSLGTTSGTAPEAASHYIVPTFSSNVGTITNAYGAVIAPGSTAGTITNGVNLFVTKPVFGSTKITALFDNEVGIGGFPFNQGTCLTLTGAADTCQMLRLQGTANKLDTNQGILSIASTPTLRPPSACVNAVGIYQGSTYDCTSANITTAFGIWIDVGAKTGGGSVTNGTNLRVDYPAFGTNKICCDFRGNVRIGSDRSGQPNLELTIIASTAGSAAVTGGSAQALPGLPVGYIGVYINGFARAIPYYAASFF